jgi:hypothetical protein
MELIGGCPNQVLIELIRQIIQRTRRYEIALMRESRNVASGDCESQRDHDGAAQARSARRVRSAQEQSTHRP